MNRIMMGFQFVNRRIVTRRLPRGGLQMARDSRRRPRERTNERTLDTLTCVTLASRSLPIVSPSHGIFMSKSQSYRFPLSSSNCFSSLARSCFLLHSPRGVRTHSSFL